jgi:hypothetical protein
MWCFGILRERETGAWYGRAGTVKTNLAEGNLIDRDWPRLLRAATG